MEQQQPDPSGAAAVSLRGVRKTYGDVVAVDRVSLDVVDGEFFSMLGPSGSGKTTTLRMIAGFELPTEGEVLLNGADVSRLPPYQRDVNTVFQDYALFPHMSVGENVGYGLMVRRVGKGERKTRVGEALEMVRLPGFESRKPSQLSGGQRQRVALARALVNRPKLLLLDEPLGALDLKLREEMQIELKAIQKDVGITFVFVTHDQDEALTLSDRLAVFNGGRIDQVGSPAEVYENPATAFVAGFVGTSNLITGDAARAIAGAEGTFTVRPEKIHLVDPGEQPSPAQCAVNGTVREVVYLGVNTRYIVSLDAGGELVVVQQNQATSSMQALAARGRQVRLIWDREHNRAVEASGSNIEWEEISSMKRSWMALAAATASLAVAAGCGGGGGSDNAGGGGSSVKPVATIGPTEGALNLIAWQGYTEPNVVKPFEAQTGCQVHVTYGQTSDDMVRLMRTGNFDGVSASGDATNRLIAAGDVKPVDVQKLIPDFKDISPALQSPPHNTVDGLHYGVSYEWGADVLMYNKDVVTTPPDSWGVIFDGTSYSGKVDAYDSPIYIADAAVYLKSAQPDLKITDPYELTQDQFDAAVNLLKKQRQAIGNYWGSYTSQISDFKNGSIVIGPTWPYQYNALVADKQNMGVVLPKEGATGWADTWMLSSKAAHPNCMLKWMAYATTPPVQAKTAYTFGSAPANPQACSILDKEVANYCTDYHVTDPAYFKSIAYWKTPLTDCGDSRGNTCVPYSEWTSAWTEIKNS